MGWPCRVELWGETMAQARSDYASVANAIIAFRFDTSELGSVWTEICAYGTAVVIEPLG